MGCIRVVVFAGGPGMAKGLKPFIHRLATHSEIFLAGVFCQSEAPTLRAVFKDRWRRRRLLALPVLLAEFAGAIERRMVQPTVEKALNRTIAGLADRIIFVPDIHAPGVIGHVKSLEPDVGLSYGSPILKPDLFDIPVWGTLGIHHGKVPEYRGKKTDFWAMYNGEATVDVTIMKINAGLDTGYVVKEGAVAVGRRSYRKVSRKLEALGIDLYIEAILDVKAGTAAYRPQAGKKGKLYRDPGIADIVKLYRKQLVGLPAQKTVRSKNIPCSGSIPGSRTK
ncbi:MAG: formyltransferase family protein [Desulfobacterales bacterium]